MFLAVWFLAACSTATRANAGTIIVDYTVAQACGCLLNNLGSAGPLFAADTQANAFATGEAVADALAGHLGALASATVHGGFGGVDAFVIVNLDLNDMTADDFLMIDMSLHGNYTPGSGGRVDLIVNDGNITSNRATISCNTFNEQNHGVSCFPGGAVQAIIPLADVDSLSLTFFLTVGTGDSSGPAEADFLNSANFSITVPSGTVIVNDPGGHLFQTAVQTTAAPEPNAGFPLGSGLVLAMLLGKRQSGWMRFARSGKTR